MHSLICQFDVLGLAVGVGIDRHRRNAHLFSRLDHAAGDFAAIGNEDLLEHVSYTSNMSSNDCGKFARATFMLIFRSAV